MAAKVLIEKLGALPIPPKTRPKVRALERLRQNLHDLAQGDALRVENIPYHQVNSACALVRTQTGCRFSLRSSGDAVLVWKIEIEKGDL